MNKNVCALLSFAAVIALLPACRDRSKDEYRAYSDDRGNRNSSSERTEYRNGERRNSKKSEREYRTMGGKRVKEKTESAEVMVDDDME